MLTTEEKELIVSALAFASSSDVVADFTAQQELVMSELVIRLKDDYELTELESVYLPYKSEWEFDQDASEPIVSKKYVGFIHFE